MKALIKLAFCGLIALNATISNANTASTKAAPTQTTAATNHVLSQQEANLLVNRVYEINTIKLNTLNKTEKHELKSELQAIRKKLTNPGVSGGVYLSTGALILIVILLIILF